MGMDNCCGCELEWKVAWAAKSFCYYPGFNIIAQSPPVDPATYGRYTQMDWHYELILTGQPPVYEDGQRSVDIVTGVETVTGNWSHYGGSFQLYSYPAAVQSDTLWDLVNEGGGNREQFRLTLSNDVSAEANLDPLLDGLLASATPDWGQLQCVCYNERDPIVFGAPAWVDAYGQQWFTDYLAWLATVFVQFPRPPSQEILRTNMPASSLPPDSAYYPHLGAAAWTNFSLYTDDTAGSLTRTGAEKLRVTFKTLSQYRKDKGVVPRTGPAVHTCEDVNTVPGETTVNPDPVAGLFVQTFYYVVPNCHCADSVALGVCYQAP